MTTNGERIIKGLEEAATGSLVAVTINGQRWIRDRIRETDSDYRPEILETPTGVEASESRLKSAQRAYNALNDEERHIFLEWLDEQEPARFDATPAGASTPDDVYIQVVIKIPLAEVPEEMDVVQFEAELMNVIIDQGMPPTEIDSRIRAGGLAPP